MSDFPPEFGLQPSPPDEGTGARDAERLDVRKRRARRAALVGVPTLALTLLLRALGLPWWVILVGFAVFVATLLTS